jgi:two-component sensor histidine kinase
MAWPESPRFRAGRLFSPWTIAVVALLAVLDTAREMVTLDPAFPADRRWVLVFHNVAWWAPWLVLVPVIGWVSSRWSVLGPQRIRAGLLHLALAVVTAPVHVLAVAGLMSLAPVSRSQWPGIPEVTGRLLQGFLLLDVVTYIAVAAVMHALEYAALLQRRAIEASALALRASELERALTTATLDTLRAQLNPHFLFNTLNSIAGLVRGGERDRAVGMIALLGDLLRETLSTGSTQVVTLSHELGILHSYLAIEETRLRDRLRVEMCVAQELENALVPSLLLQPLVENAIRHGIGSWTKGGTIQVSATCEGERITLAVMDEPREPMPARREAPVDGVGLGNTRRRLHELYGDRARLSLEFLPHGGCRAQVSMPLGATGLTV